MSGGIKLRIRLLLEPRGEVTIPFNYNRYLNAYIYSNLDKGTSDILHTDQGYKFFVFSNLLFSDKEITKEGLKTASGIKWFIASPYVEFIKELGERLLKDPFLKIGKTQLPIAKIQILRKRAIQPETHFSTISPIAVSTGKKINDKLVHDYLRPDKKDFFIRLKQNLLSKFYSFYGKLPKDQSFTITITGPVKENLIYIKETPIKAYDMHFIFRGNSKLMEFAMDAGLGEKNSMGFGMVTINERVGRRN